MPNLGFGLPAVGDRWWMDSVDRRPFYRSNRLSPLNQQEAVEAALGCFNIYAKV